MYIYIFFAKYILVKNKSGKYSFKNNVLIMILLVVVLSLR